MGRGFDAWLSMWAPPPYVETAVPDGLQQIRVTCAAPDNAEPGPRPRLARLPEGGR
jgi:hypothetical protein